MPINKVKHFIVYLLCHVTVLCLQRPLLQENKGYSGIDLYLKYQQIIYIYGRNFQIVIGILHQATLYLSFPKMDVLELPTEESLGCHEVENR